MLGFKICLSRKAQVGQMIYLLIASLSIKVWILIDLSTALVEEINILIWNGDNTINAEHL